MGTRMTATAVICPEIEGESTEKDGRRGYTSVHKERCAPSTAALQYWVNAWSEGSTPLYQHLLPKMCFNCSPHIDGMSDI